MKSVIKFGGSMVGITTIIEGTHFFVGISKECGSRPDCVTSAFALGLFAIALGGVVTYVFAKK